MNARPSAPLRVAAKQFRLTLCLLNGQWSELPQEAHVVVEQQAQVGDAVLAHDHPLDAHAEGEAGVLPAVVADGVEDGRVHHPSGQVMSTSAEGSVKGKKLGRNRVPISGPKYALANWSRQVRRSLIVTPSST